jgi:hypothetical protein
MRVKASTKVAYLQGTDGQLQLWTWLEDLEEGRPLGRTSVDLRIILNWVLHN